MNSSKYRVPQMMANRLDDGFIVGTCETMCPMDEIKMRWKENLLHYYEIRTPVAGGRSIPDEPKVVKEFRRSAAATRLPKPHELRTPIALKNTVTYLISEVAFDNRRPFNFAFDFIFDRLRAVRQEIVQQNLNDSLTIELLEPVIMFFAYSLYRLSETPIANFDPKICRQHLQECLKKVLTCYDSIHTDRGAVNAEQLSRRTTIESIYLLFNMGSVETLTRALHLPAYIKGPLLHQTISLSMAFWNRNFYKCLVRIEQLPHILCAVASLHVQHIRRELLRSFSAAYHSKVLTVPTIWVSKILGMHSETDLIGLCSYYGVKVDASAKSIKFDRDTFDVTKATMLPRHERFVENKLKIRIEDILLLKSYSRN